MVFLLPQIRFVATLTNFTELARDRHTAKVKAINLVATAALIVVRATKDKKLLSLLRHAKSCTPARTRSKPILAYAGPQLELSVVEHQVGECLILLVITRGQLECVVILAPKYNQVRTTPDEAR